MEALLSPYFITECIAFLCSLLLLVKGVDNSFRIFTLYCALVVINELFAILYVSVWHHVSNHIQNNFAFLFFFLFYNYTCLKKIKHLLQRWVIKILIVFFIVSWLINLYNSTI